MSASAQQPEPEQKIGDDKPTVTVENFETDFEFDCPESIEFKDPNIDDNRFVVDNQDLENVTDSTNAKLVRNQTRTKLYKAVEKKMTLSPISKKKKQFKPITYMNRKPILNTNERLYQAAQRRQPTYRTLAELVQDFDKKTRVYEDENVKKFKTIRKQIVHAKSPKLLSKNRNRPRTALSQLEQDELIARTIKKNTFKAQPINKRIFDNYATGIPKVQTVKKSTIKTLDFGFHSTKRFEIRREKMQAIQKSINDVNFVFKARPMPVFKKVSIMMRNNQLIKKQTSDMCLNKNFEKMTGTIVKQTSDSTLTRIAHTDLMSNCSSNENVKDKCEQIKGVTEDKQSNEKSDLTKSINESLTTETEEEDSICEFKSLINFESGKENHENASDHFSE